MHVKQRPPIVSFALKAMTGAIASVVLAGSAYAAGLGKLTVLSSLGQPLRAEIELTAVSPEEAQGLQVKLASTDAFRLANIEFNPALMSLRFEVDQRNGRQFVRVTSTQPLNEPFVDMLLELSWANGRLVREYTFLLDPADLRATQSAQVAPPQPVRPQVQATPAAPVQRQPAQPAATPPAPKAAAAEYRVRAGDTLGDIARQLKPDEVSLDVMLVALYRANPDAFIGNNMNRLRSGTILTVPDSNAIRGTGAGEARGVVVAHAADFNAYRNKLAGQVAAAEPSRAAEPSQSAAGRITARVQERPTAASESRDQLKLSRATPPATADAGRSSTVATEEERIAKERELADATARVKELERNVSELEELLTVKGEAPGAKPTGELTQTPPPVAKVEQKTVTTTVQPKPAEAPKKRVTEPGLIDTIMDNLVYIAGGLLALLLAAYAIAARRRKTIEDTSESIATLEPSTLGAPSETAHSLFAETGGQSVDTSNSVFNSSFAPSASQLDTNEVDPVAEADVYIAYGRDAQAEEILKEALRTHPERMPVRLKLLEIYAARKDQRAFETQAGEIYSLTKGTGEDWAQAAALGLTIDPLNPLYAGAAGAPTSTPAAPELEQPLLTQELDEALPPTSVPMDMDLTGEASATALPALEETPATAAPAAAREDEHTLDFDLGGLSFEANKAEATAAAPAAAPEPVQDLSFDLDATATPAAAAPEAKPAPAAELPDMAFDLDFNPPAVTPDVAAAALEEVPAAATAESDIRLDDDLSLDFMPAAPAAPAATPAAEKSDFAMADLAKELDLPSLPAAAEPTPAPALPDAMLDLDAMSFDLPPAAEETPAAAPAELSADAFSLDLPPSATEPAPAPAAPAAPSFDLSGLDLDLPSATESAEPTAVPEPIEAGAENMEMETKLDLAIAYQEIGDKEGARELVEEVIKGGTPAQVAKASALRDQLA